MDDCPHQHMTKRLVVHRIPLTTRLRVAYISVLVSRGRRRRQDPGGIAKEQRLFLGSQLRVVRLGVRDVLAVRLHPRRLSIFEYPDLPLGKWSRRVRPVEDVREGKRRQGLYCTCATTITWTQPVATLLALLVAVPTTFWMIIRHPPSAIPASYLRE